jgi:hypothetical protein
MPVLEPPIRKVGMVELSVIPSRKSRATLGRRKDMDQVLESALDTA